MVLPGVSDAERDAINGLLDAVRSFIRGPEDPVDNIDLYRQFAATQIAIVRAARELVAVWTGGGDTRGPEPWNGGPALAQAVAADPHLGDRELDKLLQSIGVEDDATVIAALRAHQPVIDAVTPVFNSLDGLVTADRVDLMIEEARRAGLEFEKNEWVNPDGTYVTEYTHEPPEERPRQRPAPTRRTGGPSGKRR